MAKLDEYREQLKEYEGKTVTTKLLMEDLGITTYYIKKLADQNIIRRVGKELYEVNILTNNKNFDAEFPKNSNSFQKFKTAVLAGNYEKAYDDLVACVEEQKNNHDYDNHYRIYFLLLTYILSLKGVNKELYYDYEDKLLEFYDEARTEYFESYLKFRYAVLAKEYAEAYKYLKEYAVKEKIRYKENRVSTKIFQRLLEEIAKSEENRKKVSSKLNQIYKLNYEKKYEELKIVLEDVSLLLGQNVLKSLSKYMIDLCQALIDFKNDETLILDSKKCCNLSGQKSIVGAFLFFMKNKDYLSAVNYVEKCCQQYKGSLFDVAQDMLKEIIFLSNTHSYKYRKTEIQEMRLTTVKSNKSARKHFSSFLSSLQSQDFATAFKEIKLNLSYLEDDKEYTYKRSYNLYLLLKFLEEMKENKSILDSSSNVYLENDSDSFNFNLAIKLGDFKAAKLYLSKIDNGSSLTLEAYDIILKEIFNQDKINHGESLSEKDELTLTSNPSNANIDEENKENLKQKKPCEVFDPYEAFRNNDVLEAIKNLKLNYKTLYNLIRNSEFDEAYALITREEEMGYSLESVGAEVIEENQDDIKNICAEKIEAVEESSIVDQENNAGEETIKDDSLSEEEKHKLAVLETIKDVELNDDNLSNLIYDRKYEEARYLIERERENNNYYDRLTINVYNLIIQLQQIQRGIIKEIVPKTIDYSLGDLKVFYAALNNRDYNLALEYANHCIESVRDKKEIQLMRLILEDIVVIYNRVMEEKKQKEIEKQEKGEKMERLVNINAELKELSYKYEFSSLDVNKILSLLKEKVEIAQSYYNMTNNIDVFVLGVAEAAEMALKHDLNLGCFARIGTHSSRKPYSDDTYSAEFSTNSIEVQDIFYDALRYGDLITVYDIITTENWEKLHGKMSPVNLRLIKSLLDFVNSRTPIHEISEEELTRKEMRIRQDKVTAETQEQIDNAVYGLLNEQEKEVSRHIDFLRYLDSAVDKDHFTDALDKLLMIDDEFNDPEVISSILLANSIIQEENESLFKQILQAEKTHNVEDALRSLKKYKEYVNQVFVDCNTDYLDKRINILKKDLTNKNYKSKERQYSQARSLFNKGQYEKSLGVINAYIANDRYVNNKGFVLRGDNYFEMGNIDRAKEAYLKAFMIAQDPEVCLKLGNIYFLENDYEKAIYYFELYRQMKPSIDINVSRKLVTCYNSIGKTKETQKYDARLRHLSYLK